MDFTKNTVRLGVVSFLLYLRLSFLPTYTKSQQSNGLADQSVQRTAEVYLVTWELLSFLGSCALYASVSALVYKWRSLLNGDMKSNIALIAGMNAILFFIGLFCVVMQYFFEFKNYTWVHIVYYFTAINIFIMGVVFLYHADKLADKVKPRSDISFQLFKHGLYNKYSAVVCAIAFITRGIVLALDSIGYRYLTDGSRAQVVWNIFFKYICWVIPELIIVLCLLYCISETEDFHNILAYMYSRVRGGNASYSEVAPVEISDIEDVLKTPHDISNAELQEMREKTEKQPTSVANDAYTRFEDE